MALTNLDFIEGVKASRKHFLKHLEGLTPEQIAWKPYPEAKSVIETLQHLIVDDMAALQSFQSGEEPNYEAFHVEETEYNDLATKLAGSHQDLIGYLEERYGNAPLDAAATVWGTPLPAARAIAYLISEDFFHAGQVSFIRLATDPTWDYYATIYG